MRRLLARSALSLVLLAPSAHAAAGVNLRWQDCFGDGGTFNRSFACDTNTGSNVLVSSFVLGTPIPQASGNEVVIDILTGSLTFPSWWMFKNAGTCRQTSMSAVFAAPATAVACVDWVFGGAFGGIGTYTVGARGPGSARIVMASAVPGAGFSDLVVEQEYFSNEIIISNAKTVGDGNCSGCEIPVCILLSGIKVTTPVAANDRTLTGPTNGTDSFFVVWQGGVITAPQFHGCPTPTPTRRETWGAVKALYR